MQQTHCPRAPNRRRLTASFISAALLLPLAAHAQTYPDQPVRVLHGFAAGGTIAAGSVARAKPDGYTLLLAPAGTPQPVFDKLHQQLRETLQDPAVHTRLVEVTGGDVQSSTPAEMQASIDGDLRRWGQLVKKAKIQKE